MNKRKPDDEFANIHLSFFKASGEEVIVHCPESKSAAATQQPARRRLTPEAGSLTPRRVASASEPISTANSHEPPEPLVSPARRRQDDSPDDLKEKHFTILYGDTGYSYESIIGPYLQGAKALTIEDPYIRLPHQIQNFVRFCETVIRSGSVKNISLVTGYDDRTQLAEIADKMEELRQSLLDADVVLSVKFNENLHDREIRLDNGWVIKMGRGLDFYQKPASWYELGAHDLSLRKCLETKVDIFRA